MESGGFTSDASGLSGGSWWAFPAVMIASMLGSWLLGLFSGKGHKPYNEETRNINLATKLDVLPYLIGTDICPGQVVWFGQMSLYDAATLRSTGVYNPESSYFSSYYKPLSTKFAVAFCQNHEATNYAQHNINRVFFGGKDVWHWGLWLSEAVKWENITSSGDFGEPGPITLVKSTWASSYGFDYLLKLPDPDVPHCFYTYISYDGWFGDFSIAETLGVGVTTDNDINFRQTIKLTQFPDITSEISSQYSNYSGEAFDDASVSFGGILGGVLSVTRHSCRDGEHDYFYAFYYGYTSDPGGLQVQYQFWRVHPIFGKTLIANDPPVLNGITYIDIRTITHGFNNSSSLSRTDIWDNRLYFFQSSIVAETNHWLVGDSSYKHHAPYSFRYSLFYIDRNDTLNPVPLKVGEYITGINHFDTGSCAFVARSMEVTKNDKVLVFGHLVQDAFPLVDQLRVTQDTVEPGTRIYMDLSGYPDNWWLNKYIWENISNLNVAGIGVPVKIINQTSTYVDTDAGMGRNPAQGAYMTLCYAKRFDRKWVQADVGSTTTLIICNCPSPSTMKTNNGGRFEGIIPIGSNYNTTYTIDYGETEVGGNIHLVDPLPTAPVPGQRYWLVPEGTVTYDPDVVNPEIPYHAYADDHNGGDSWHYDEVTDNLDNFNIFAVLQFDKNTGEFEGVLHKTLATNYMSSWLIYAHGDDLITTCATEEEISVYYTCMQYATCGKICQWIINSNNLAFSHVDCGGNKSWNEDELWESNPYSCGHAWGVNNVATAWLWVKDENTGNYFRQWYGLSYDYPENSINFLKLYNGRFFNDSENTPIFKRPYMYTGPLYNGWWFQGTVFTEDMHIAKCGIENKLFISLNHAYDGGNYSFGGYAETWVFGAPTTENINGSLRLIHATGEGWVRSVVNGVMGNWNFTSTFTTVFKSGFQWFGGCSYHCDENPLEAIIRLVEHNSLSKDGYGYGYINFPTNYYTFNFPVFDYCDQSVDVQAVVGNSIVSFREPRFRYSLCLDSTQSVMDIVKDIMQSCLGWAFPCGRYLNFVVPTATETPKLSFGKENNPSQFEQQINIPDYPGSWDYVQYGYTDSTLKLNLDLSNYPINYFLGESGSFYHNGTTYDFVVIEHLSTTQIKVSSYDVGYTVGLNSFCYNAYWGGVVDFQGVVVTINPKDNIKEGTFTFSQKSRLKRPNLVRVEFNNRLNGYVTEIAESDSDYLRHLDGYDKIQTYKMPGIKRATQAGRISQQLMDYIEFVEWGCAFETDVMGMYLCPGDIVTVTHDITGWFGKWFRIMSMEESGDDFNTKLILEEYNPYVYNDYGPNLLLNTTYGGFTPGNSDWTQISLPVTNISVFESTEFPQLYFGFRNASGQTNVIGGRVFRYNGVTYDIVGNVAPVPVTMFLVNNLTDSILDNGYIEYSNLSGTLPESGIVWIGSELIYYNGIDTSENKLMNLVRGYNDTVISSHSANDVITLYGTENFIEIQESWIGSNTFKVVPLVFNNAPLGDLNNATTITVTIVGYGYKPHFPESLRLTEE